jgi:hypothetical protein
MRVIFSVSKVCESVKEVLSQVKASKELQALVLSVGELGKSLIIHESAAFCLDYMGLREVGWLVRQRGQWSFWLKATLLLALSPPYLAKSSNYQEDFEIVGAEQARRIPGVVEHGCRDVINLNILHVLVLLIGGKLLSVIQSCSFQPSVAIPLCYLTQAYVQGHFLAQYPAAKENLSPSSVIHQLAGKTEWILGLGLLAVLGRELLSAVPMVGPPLVLLWNLSLILIAFHCREIGNPLRQAPSKVMIDPGLLAWNALNRGIEYFSVPQSDPSGIVWGRRLKVLMDSYSFKKARGILMSEASLQGLKLMVNGLGCFELRDAFSPSARFISEAYADFLWSIAGVIHAHGANIERAQRILKSTVGGHAFNHLARPFLRWRYGKQGAVNTGIVVTDFILTAFPEAKPEFVMRGLKSIAEMLSSSKFALEGSFERIEKPVGQSGNESETHTQEPPLLMDRLPGDVPQSLNEPLFEGWSSVDSAPGGRVAIVTRHLGHGTEPRGQGLLAEVGSIFDSTGNH